MNLDQLKDLALVTVQFYVTLALAVSASAAYLYFYVIG